MGPYGPKTAKADVNMRIAFFFGLQMCFMLNW